MVTGLVMLKLLFHGLIQISQNIFRTFEPDRQVQEGIADTEFLSVVAG